MPLKNKKSARLNTVVPVIIIVYILDLLFLYYLKYRNQDLSLSEFRLDITGNMLNFIITLIVCAGVIIFSLQKKKKPTVTTLIVFTIILNVILILAAVSISVKIPLSKNYFLGHPFPEVLTGFLFLLYQYVLFIFISFLWLNIFGGKDLLILRAVVNSIILVLVLFLFAFFYLSTGKDTGIMELQSKDPGNVAVVFGAAVWSNNEPSPSLAARAEKAADLLRRGYVGYIQLTGSNAPGELSEAEAAYNYIKTKNIDTTLILVERKTTSTSEQVEFIKNNLLKKNTTKDVIIISDSYHLARINEICKFYNVKAEVVASGLMLNYESKIYYKLRESIALILFWTFAL